MKLLNGLGIGGRDRAPFAIVMTHYHAISKAYHLPRPAKLPLPCAAIGPFQSDGKGPAIKRAGLTSSSLHPSSSADRDARPSPHPMPKASRALHPQQRQDPRDSVSVLSRHGPHQVSM